jgi:hypothetical protein
MNINEKTKYKGKELKTVGENLLSIDVPGEEHGSALKLFAPEILTFYCSFSS